MGYDLGINKRSSLFSVAWTKRDLGAGKQQGQLNGKVFLVSASSPCSNSASSLFPFGKAGCPLIVARRNAGWSSCRRIRLCSTKWQGSASLLSLGRRRVLCSLFGASDLTITAWLDRSSNRVAIWSLLSDGIKFFGGAVTPVTGGLWG